MKTSAYGVLPVALALLLGACEQTGPHHGQHGAAARPVSEVAPGTLTTDATSYAAGAPVTVRLANRSRAAFGYNLCRASLDRNVDEDWRQVQPTLGEACTAEIRTLHPGQTASFSFRLDRQLRRGQYRVRLADPAGRERYLAVSNNFMLQGNDSD